MERILMRALLIACLCCFGIADAAEVRVSGLSAPFRDVIFSAPTYGTIDLIRVKEGETVKEGQVLMEMLKMVEELEVERRKLILDDKSEVKVAAEQVNTLKAGFESTKELYESTGSVSKEDVAAKELEYKKAMAEEERLKASETRQAVDLKLAEETLAGEIHSLHGWWSGGGDFPSSR